jgi:hypothetical protein
MLGRTPELRQWKYMIEEPINHYLRRVQLVAFRPNHVRNMFNMRLSMAEHPIVAY